MTEGRYKKIKNDLRMYDNVEALSLIEYLENKNERLKKDNESYEQIFWDKDNEIATLKKKLDKLKNKGGKECITCS